MLIMYYFLQVFEILLVVRIVMSWVRPDPSNPLVRMLFQVTDPVLDPVRKLIPAAAGGIDFSPIVVFLIIDVVKRVIVPGQGVW
jgi:YggT family protein